MNKVPTERQLKYWESLKGKKHSSEHKKRIGISCTGGNSASFKKGQHKSINTEFKKGLTPWNKRKKHLGGEKHWNWQGGKLKQSEKIRKSIEYKIWRTAVFERDNYTCIWCGKNGGYLEADHIKPFSLFPELRFAIDNGRTLCKECHRKTDTYLNKLRWKNVKNVEN